MPPELDLSAPRVLHIVGAGGAGMSAIATVLARMGHHVTGSDLKGSPRTERLRIMGVEVHVGHSPDNVPAARSRFRYSRPTSSRKRRTG